MSVRILAKLILLAWALHLAPAAALASNPSIESAKPPLAQRGSTFELRLEGSGFTSDAEFMFYRQGVKCQSIRVESETTLSAEFACDPGCPLGAHPFRLRTSQGISELRVLHVSPFPIMRETEENNDAAHAEAVSGDATVIGSLPGSDVDCFKVVRKKGELIAAEVQGIRLGIGMFDSRLRLIGPDGKTLAQVDDTPLFAQDPYFTVAAPADGEYLIEIANSSQEADDGGVYGLHLGGFPRPNRAFPCGGKAGETVKVRLLGDAAGPFEQEVALPAVASEFPGLFAEREGRVSPTATPFRVVDFGNWIESEPNEKAADLPTEGAALPIAFNGALQSPGDVDHFRFRGVAGQLIAFEAFAAQLGSMLDTVLSIHSLEGEELARNDDYLGLDSRLVWRCPGSGDYLLRVQDKRRTGGELHFYRIEAKSPAPSIVAFLARRDRQSQAGQIVRVPRGNRVLALLGVRRHGFEGAAEVAFPQLPPGVSAQFASIPADQYLAPVVLEAQADAPIVGQFIAAAARSVAPSGKVEGGFEQVVDLVASSADRAFSAISVDRLAMAVTDPAPFRIRLAPLATSLPRDGSLEVTIEVERDANFDGAIEVTFPFLPAWVDGPDKVTIGADAKSAIYSLRAHPEVSLQKWPLVAEGKQGLAPVRDESAAAAPGVPGFRRRREGRGGGKNDQVVSTQLSTLEIAAAPISGTIGELIAQPGKELIVTIPLRREGAIPETMTASLVGLPARVTAEQVQISAADAEVTFKVQPAGDAPLGEFANLFCELAGTLHGQRVTYRIGRGGSLKIVRPEEFVVDASGRPLSRLDILRKSQARDRESNPTTGAEPAPKETSRP